MNSYIQLCDNFVIKKENPHFPEALKYIILNDIGAPVVKLIDTIIDDNDTYLVLERVRDNNLDSSMFSDFNIIMELICKMNSLRNDLYPRVNLQYYQNYWNVFNHLHDVAISSDLFEVDILKCLPKPNDIFTKFLGIMQQSDMVISHGDPANSNMGFRRSQMIFFDLGLSFQSHPMVDFSLRTGAQATKYPSNMSISDEINRYLDKINYNCTNSKSVYFIISCILGCYMEQTAIDSVFKDGKSSKYYGWCNNTLKRYIKFSSGVF
ncbi:hypothetical protein LBMAG53_27590 [Planctomycetota bacterium]|nr:hypothetical protein LBMAG53_27590 [Planctomycetota bacterium]